MIYRHLTACKSFCFFLNFTIDTMGALWLNRGIERPIAETQERKQMKEKTFRQTCNAVAEHTQLEVKDWGLRFIVATEIDALRIAYAYKNNPSGVKVDRHASENAFVVTVFNETA